MTDPELLALFQCRDERVLERVQAKYGPWCRSIARNILGSEPDVEECLSDCWLALWNAIPPAQPKHFQGYLGAVVRNRALLLRKRRAHHGDTVSLATLELAACLSDKDSPERQAEAAELGRAMSDFLRREPPELRTAFLRRYWYADTVDETARRMGWSVSKTKSALFRIRKKLKLYLEQEGLL